MPENRGGFDARKEERVEIGDRRSAGDSARRCKGFENGGEEGNRENNFARGEKKEEREEM